MVSSANAHPELRLEEEAQGELCLTGIAYTNAEKAVEVEEGRRAKRVEIVGVVKGIEDFGARFEGELAIVEVKRTGYAKVEDEEGIILAKVIATAVDAADEACEGVVDAAGSTRPVAGSVVRLWLGGVLLNADVSFEAER